MVLLFAVFCVCAVAGKPAFKFNWTPLLEVIPHGHPRAHARVVGGVEAEPHKYGYQAALIRDGQFICGGVVISDQFVLTAAHCVTSGNANYAVLLGGHDLTTTEESHQTIAVGNVYVHPDYDAEEIRNDIAVLKLKRKIKMNEKVFPLNLPMNNVRSGMPLVITGWGVTKSGVQPFSVLQKMTTSAIGHSYCRQAYPWLDSSMFCVYVPESPATTCSGDSGGPAAHQNSIMGITSFGAKGCLSTYPQGFANVFEAKDWIETVMERSGRSPSGSSLSRPCTLLVLCLVGFVLVYPFLYEYF